MIIILSFKVLILGLRDYTHIICIASINSDYPSVATDQSLIKDEDKVEGTRKELQPPIHMQETAP